jgi:glycosyltransferase involved in cell wall biosynthesis
MSQALVITVLNEAKTVGRLLDSVLAQALLPDEVVVCDGGSTDGTLEILEAYGRRLPLRVIRAPGSTIAAGRNRAIEATRAERLAVTDAGVRLDPGWFRALMDALDDPRTVAAGAFAPDPVGWFERALAAVTLPLPEEIPPDRFLPSSRSVAFYRSAWAAVGGYPEWLDYCEDVVFDLKLLAAGCRFRWVPEAVVYFRPRPDIPAFFRQYFNYARGDGKAGLWPERHTIRYGAYGWLIYWLLRGRRNPALTAALGVGAAFYLRRPLVRYIRRLGRGLPPAEFAAGLALLPVLRFVGDLAKMAGYPSGVYWRSRYRPPSWR